MPILALTGFVSMTPVSTPSPTFAYGRFLGDYRAQREVGALMEQVLPKL
jgi:hypothetical protein